MSKPNTGITNSPFIGLQNFHIAKLMEDPANGTATYEEVISIPHVREIGIKPQSAMATH